MFVVLVLEWRGRGGREVIVMAMASSLPPGFEGAVLGSLPASHHIPQTNVSSQQGRESKKVSWASEDILCQVRLFAAEDAPAQSSVTLQELLQAKKAKMMHMVNPVKTEDLPPGFGVPFVTKGIQAVVFDVVPQLQWRIPEHFNLDSSWLVMAGQESIEVSVQGKRENRTLEAVYPRPSAIPDSPAEPSESQLPFDEDDANTLIIPVVPLEDDDLPDQDDIPTTSGSTYEILQEYTFPREKSLSPPPGFTLQTSIPTKSRPWFPEAPQEVSTSITASSTAPALGPPVSTGRNAMPPNGIAMHTTSISTARAGPLAPPARTNDAGPDVAAAAAAAYAALSQSNDATMIDRELLIKFLTNPSMLQNLSEKLAQNPPGTIGSLEPHTGNGARGNGRPWNPTVTEQNKGGQRYPETSIPVADTLPGHGYDRPPGFGVPPLGANGLGQAPPQSLGQGYAPPRLQALQPQSTSPPISATQPTVSGSGRSISQRDDQYYKDLISQHGRKNEESVWGGVAAVETGNSYPGGGRPRANGPDRDRKLEKSDRIERSERPDSGARWAERDDMDMAGMPVRQGDGESRSGQSRGKSRKACIYFSTSRGCRNGKSCAFVHESNNGERAKRPKLEGKDSKGYR